MDENYSGLIWDMISVVAWRNIIQYYNSQIWYLYFKLTPPKYDAGLRVFWWKMTHCLINYRHTFNFRTTIINYKCSINMPLKSAAQRPIILPCSSCPLYLLHSAWYCTNSSVATLLFSVAPGVQIFGMIFVIVLIILSVTSKQTHRDNIIKH